jgi:acyl-coenzyme A synthetase/AMP-(fatty) acid ligase
MSRTPEWVINCFGILKAGAAGVLLDSGSKAPELEPQLRESDSKILITEERFSPLLSSVLPNTPLLKHVLRIDTDSYKEMVVSSSPAAPRVNIEGEDEAILFYTLGVLGKNKGVVHTHSSFLSILPIVVQKFELERNDVILGLLPFNYLLGFGLAVLMPIWSGATIAILPHFSSKNILDTIQQEKATMLIGVPASFNAMAMMDEETMKSYDLGSLRSVLCAGAKSSAFFLEALEKKYNCMRNIRAHGVDNRHHRCHPRPQIRYGRETTGGAQSAGQKRQGCAPRQHRGGCCASPLDDEGVLQIARTHISGPQRWLVSHWGPGQVR